MRREISKWAALALGVLTLGVGPWLGLPANSVASFSPWSALVHRGDGGSLIRPQTSVPDDTPVGLVRRASRGCTCRAITVNADNFVKNAEVETGDATVVNRSITYIAPTYGEDEVEIEQEAEAKTGDAIAGQILSVNGGDGCSQVTVRAKNIVRDAEVRSGDATARNESLVLLDPRLQAEELEIEVDQEAEADSGDAVAGQIIGIKGGGGPCGGVILEALNDVRNVEVESGDATTENISEIQACKEAGCSKELRKSLEGVLLVDVCDAKGCRPVRTDRFIEMLEREAREAEDGIDADQVGDPDTPIEKAAAESDDGEDDDDSDADDTDEEQRRPMPRWFYRHQPKPPADSSADDGAPSNATPTATQAPGS